MIPGNALVNIYIALKIFKEKILIKTFLTGQLHLRKDLLSLPVTNIELKEIMYL